MSTFENLLTFERGAGVTNVDPGGGKRWVTLGSRLLQTDRAATLKSGSPPGAGLTTPLGRLLICLFGWTKFQPGHDFQWVRKG
jgi:hypothetical protein